MSVIVTEPGVAVARLIRASRILLTCHRSPDGDALGSELALAELADGFDIKSVICNRDSAPSSLDELPGANRVLTRNCLPSDFPDAYDLVVTVECPGLDRPGLDGIDQLPILNIDHHQSNEGFGEVNFVDEKAPAVGEMVWQMFREAGQEPSPEVATNTYVALATDTGDFSYANATPRAFRAAAEMVAAGADPTQVAEWVHYRRTPGSIRLLGEALRTLTLQCNGQLATITVDADAFVRAAARPEETENLINLPRTISGVRVVAFFKQWEPGVVRVSLRSTGNLNVRRVAEEFGGGGHTNASGCTVRGELEAARREVVAGLSRLFGGGS